MTQPDEEHVVLYRVIADFDSIRRAANEARASQKQLADDIERANKRIKDSDDVVSNNRQRIERVERGLVEDEIRRRQRLESEIREGRLELGRYDQAVARTATAQRQVASSSDAMFAAIARSSDAFLRARRVHEENTRQLNLELAALHELQSQTTAAGVLSRRPSTQATATATQLGGGGGGGGGVSIAQLAATAALLSSLVRSRQQPLPPPTVSAGGTTQIVTPAPGVGAEAPDRPTRAALPRPPAPTALPSAGGTDVEEHNVDEIQDRERRIRARIDKLLGAVGAVESDLTNLQKIRLVNVANDLERGVSPAAAARAMATGAKRGDLESQIAAVIREENRRAAAGPRDPSRVGTSDDLRPVFEQVRRDVSSIREAEQEAPKKLADALQQQAETLRQARQPQSPAASREAKFAEDEARARAFREAADAGARDLTPAIATPESEAVLADERRQRAEARDREIAAEGREAEATREARTEGEKLAAVVREQAKVLQESREEHTKHAQAVDEDTGSQKRLSQEVLRTAGLLRQIRSRAEGEELLQPLSGAQRREAGELALQQDLPKQRRDLIESLTRGVRPAAGSAPSSTLGKEVDDLTERVQRATTPQEAADLLTRSKLTNEQLKVVAQRLGARTTGLRLKRDLQQRILESVFGAAEAEGLLPPRAVPKPGTARRDEPETGGAPTPLSKGHVPSHLEQRMEVSRGISDKVADLRRQQAAAHKDDIDALRFASDETKRAHAVLTAFVPMLEKKNAALRAQKKAHDDDSTAIRKAIKGTEEYSGVLNELSSDLQHFQDRVSNRERFERLAREREKGTRSHDDETQAVERSTAQTERQQQAVETLIKAFQTKNRELRDQTRAHHDDADAVHAASSATDALRDSSNRFTSVVRNQAGALRDRDGELRKGDRDSADAFTRWQHFTSTVQNQSAAIKANASALKERGAAGSFGGPRDIGDNVVRDIRSIGRSAQDATGQVGGLTSAVRGLRDVNRRRGGDGGGFVGSLIESFASTGDRIGRSLGRAATHVVSFRSAVYTLIAALGPVVAVLGALGAAAIGAGNTLVSLAGAALALPALFGAAAIGIGTLVSALGPVAAAFKAYQANQKAVSAGSIELSKAQADAADRLRNAQRAYVSAAHSLANAQYDEKKSQQDLNDARREALRDLEDLRAELERSTLNEQSAILSLKEAQDAYLRALADPNATLLDRERALLRIYEAEQDLKDVRRDNGRIAEDAANAEARGVENSERVIDAKRRSFEASEAVIDAQLRLADATRDLTDAQHESAAGGSAIAKSADVLADALGKLSPATRTVVTFLFGMADAWQKIRQNVSERIFAPIIPQLQNLKSLLPVVESFMNGAADAIGRVAAKGIEMVTSGPWKADFGTLAASNAKIMNSFGDAGLAVADAFRNITVAAAPFSEWIADAIARTAEGFRDWAAGARESGDLADFLDTTRDRLSQVWVIIKNLAAGFWSLFEASEGFTTWFLDRVEAVTGRFRDWAKAQEEATSPFKKWLEDVKPLLADVWHLIEDVAGAFGSLGARTQNIDEARKILQTLSDRILPSIVELFTNLSETGTLSTLADAIATILDGLNTFIEKGGATPIQTFVNALALIAGYWKEIAENPVTFTLLNGFLTVVGALITAAAIGKLTGLFFLARQIERIVSGFRTLRALRAGAVLDDITRSRGGLGGLSDALATPGSVPTRPLYVYITNWPPGFRGAPGVPGAPGDGGGGTVVAGGGTGGTPTTTRPPGRTRRIARGIGRAAIPASLLAFILPSLFGGDDEGGFGGTDALGLGLLGAGFLPDLIGLFGGGGGAAAGGAAGAGGAAAGGGLAALLGPIGLAVGSGVGIGAAGKWLTEKISPGMKGNPENWIPFAGPTRALGQKFGSALGVDVPSESVFSGAFWTKGAQEMEENWGKFKDRMTGWWNGAVDWLTDNPIKNWIEDHISKPLMEWLEPFGDIFLGIEDATKAALEAAGEKIAEGWSAANDWVHDNVTEPTRKLLRRLGGWISSAYSSGRTWVQDNVSTPALNQLRRLGGWIARSTAPASQWAHDHLTVPARNAFSRLGGWVSSAWSGANKWAHDHLTVPVQNFFKGIGSFFAGLPDAIERAAESLPFVGPFIRARRESHEVNVITPRTRASGGLIDGHRDGRVDNIPILATVGEFMIRRRVVERPGVKRLLTALNEEQLDPAALYAALDIATKQGNFPFRVPEKIIGGAPTTINSTRTGMAFGDVIIHNPRQERSSASIRRTLQTLAFMAER